MSTEQSNYRVKLQDRYLVAERTMAFQLEKPTGFTFKPGQWIDITLVHPFEVDAGGKVRGFSIASAPADDFLLVATRMRDTAFKQEFGKMPLGSEVEITMPGGSFNLHKNPERAAIFLAGGIGVTPVRSILRHAAHEKLEHKIVFFFINSTPERAPFLKELEDLQRENTHYKLVATMTRMEESKEAWNGERGKVDQAVLEKYTRDAKSPIYYVVGPPGMVRATQKMLEEAGCDSDDIRTEGFGGY